MTEKKSITLTDVTHEGLRKFWRSSPGNKKKVENWVDSKTRFGSVPVFLRAASTDLYQKIVNDLKIPKA